MPRERMDTLAYENTRLADYTNDSTLDRGHIDIPYLVLSLVLLTIGLIMVLSASYASAYYDMSDTSGNATYYFSRQIVFSAVGIIAMIVLSRIPIGIYKRLSWIFFGAAVITLAIVAVKGKVTNGAQRWINLGFISFQPSEIAKIALIIQFSTMICRFKDKMGDLVHGVLAFLGILAIYVILLALEPHFSAIMIMVTIGVVLMFVGGTRLFWFIGGGGLLAAAALFVYANYPYVQNRVSAWLHPFQDASDTGYQVVQSLYAIGSGGFLGLGLGNSRQKYLYLPEEHNDYIFSVICEELGYVGAVLIIVLFALLVARGFWIARHASDRFSYLMAVGISTLFAVQVALNIAVCTNAIPSTGISLPLFSYGGTALLINLSEIGMMLSISKDIRREPLQ